jgi:oligoribonuclease NrnB/cAMP/cGMP phosphodiesterase (DHH superfamily)
VTDRKGILVLYHSNCTDGWTAAWCAWRKFGDSAEYLPATYQSGEVFDVAGREVYILDYCPQLPELLSYTSLAKSCVVLDHHKSAEETCAQLDYCHFDQHRSGAGMAWDYFHSEKPRPTLVNYVEDRDLWRWALPDSHAVSAVLSSYAHGDFELWQMLVNTCENSRDILIRAGEAIERSKAIDIANYKRNAVLSKFAGYPDVPVVNAGGNIISDLVNQLASKNYFAVAWNQVSDGTFRYSMRSNGDFDVSTIAKRFGGGGHKNASGFSSEHPPWDLHMGD